MPVMFARCFCALLGFRAREIPTKTGKPSGHLSLTEGYMLGPINDTYPVPPKSMFLEILNTTNNIPED